MGAEQIQGQVNSNVAAQLRLPESHVPGAGEENRTVRVTGKSMSGSTGVSELLVTRLTIPAGGSVELDLTAAPIIAADDDGRPADTEDMTGKRLRLLELATPGDNTGSITVAPADTDGYDLFGATGSVDLEPGDYLLRMAAAESMPPIGAEDKIVAFAGTEGDHVDVLMGFE